MAHAPASPCQAATQLNELQWPTPHSRQLSTIFADISSVSLPKRRGLAQGKEDAYILSELFLLWKFRYEVAPMGKRRPEPMTDDGQSSAPPASRVAPAGS